MKREAATAVGAGLECSGMTRAAAHCRGHARYRCVCGRAWCGTHVVRSGEDLRCPVCGREVSLA